MSVSENLNSVYVVSINTDLASAVLLPDPPCPPGEPQPDKAPTRPPTHREAELQFERAADAEEHAAEAALKSDAEWELWHQMDDEFQRAELEREQAEEEITERREYRRQNVRRHWVLKEFDSHGEHIGFRNWAYNSGYRRAVKGMRKRIREHNDAFHPVCVQTDLGTGAVRMRELPGFRPPLNLYSAEVTPHRVKWTITAWEPLEDVSVTLGRFDGFKDAAAFLKKLSPRKYSGHVITLNPPGDLYYEDLPVWPGRWLVGAVDSEDDRAFAAVTYQRRKDALAFVRRLIRRDIRPVLVAPWTDNPSLPTLEQHREAQRAAQSEARTTLTRQAAERADEVAE